MNLTIDKQYKYITYLDALDQIVSGPKEIIYSSEVNHNLLAMMYAKNKDEQAKIIPDRMIYGNLTSDEISILSRIGCAQFDEVNEFESKYEYRSLLDTMMLTVIDIPSNVYYVYLQESLDSDGLLIDLTSLTDANKLMMIVQSPKVVDNLSAEIHNSMLMPHYNTTGLILLTSELNNYLSQKVVTDDGRNIQSNTDFGSPQEPYELDLDTRYILGIWDKIGNRYINLINEDGKII